MSDVVNESQEIVMSSLEDDLKSLDFIFVNTNENRSKLIDKLSTAVLNMELDPDDTGKGAATRLLAKTGLINAYASLLSDQEKSISTRVTIKTKQKELLQDADKTDAFVATVAEINRNRNKHTSTLKQDVINLYTSIEGIEVKETELRDDPMDLS